MVQEVAGAVVAVVDGGEVKVEGPGVGGVGRGRPCGARRIGVAVRPLDRYLSGPVPIARQIFGKGERRFHGGLHGLGRQR